MKRSENSSPFQKVADFAENWFESGIFLSRWIQAPIYAALILAAVLYAWKSVQEVYHLIIHIRTISESEIMIGLLSLVDISMVANLVNMVVIGGYVTFVSKIDFGEHRDRPDWLDHINANSLKIKLAGSLASISAIHLLKSFIDMNMVKDAVMSPGQEKVVLWQAIIHVVFLVSMIFFAWSERIQSRTHSH